MRRLALVAGVFALAPAPAAAEPPDNGMRAVVCPSAACAKLNQQIAVRKARRIVRRALVRARWMAVRDGYGRGLLAARLQCESGHDGGYSLTTTGNGYWFAYQFDGSAWRGAGGRVTAGGRPRGKWSYHPTPLEQDFRAAEWDRIHGGDPWPNCP